MHVGEFASGSDGATTRGATTTGASTARSAPKTPTLAGMMDAQRSPRTLLIVLYIIPTLMAY